MKKIPNISFQSAENKKGFELLNLKELFSRIDKISDHNPMLPHKISFFALLIVTKGTGTHQVDLKEYNLQEGSVLKIAKGQVHAFQKQAKYEGYLIIFTEKFVLNYFSKSSIELISHLYNYHLNIPISINKENNDSLINQLHNELELNNSYAQYDIIAAILVTYLLRLERSTISHDTHKVSSQKYDTFIQFKNLVETSYTKTRNVKDYAEKLFISSKYLNLIVKEFTISTAKNFIDDYVILEVKRNIVSTTKSFKEIAFEAGFDEVSNFTKFFKKKMNCTPKEFRSL